MSNQVLIAAPDAAARASAEIARSLHLTAVVAASEQEALDRLDEGPFRFIAVACEPSWKRVRAAAESKQPAAAILDLPDANGDDATIRGLMLRCLEPARANTHFSEERYRFLSNIIESFTSTLELREVLRRIVTMSREELRADRGWLLRAVSTTAETGSVGFVTAAPGVELDPNDAGPIQLVPSPAILRRAMEAPRPIVVHSSDPDIDAALAERNGARSTLLQILRPREGEPWAFGLHQATDRRWTDEESDLFMEIGRCATLALNNSLLHNRIGSVLLSRDVTEERQNAEREAWRRRRAECLASLGLENITVQTNFDNLDETAQRVADAIQGTVRIYLYHSGAGVLDLVGYASNIPNLEPLRDYYGSHPYRPGDGLTGTVFQIGRPLLFYEVRGNALIDFARDEEEREVKAAMGERSLIACPIESYGDRIGAIVISQSDPRRNFDAEDLEFAQSLAGRIGAAAHIHRLTHSAQEGHRAADELARNEVDARARFEAVLENAPVGVAVISADELRFELANPRFVDFAAEFGKISPDTRIIGLRVTEVVPGFEQTLEQVAERGESRTDEAFEIDAGQGPKYFNRIISAVRGRFSGITQSVTILLQDVTEQVVEERQNRAREAWRRRRAECLAGLGLESVTVQPFFEDLDEPARRVAEAVGGSAMIFLYHAPAGELHMVGFGSVAEHADRYRQYREYLSHNPYHPGEGLAGTVFQIGRPLLFSDVRGDAVIDFGRSDDEKALLAGLSEESVIACPIESYGDRIGALIIARSDSPRNFDAEDLEFAQSLADRIGAAAHIHRLTRIAQEGHRAAEELARREVDARVRFEAVLETAPIGIAVVSADELRFELANARWIEFASRVGRIPPDTKLIGLGIGEVRLGLAELVKQVAESGDMRIDEELEIVDGRRTMYVTRIISPVRGRFSGITQSLTILIQDVTDQVRAKREIEALARMMAERSARLDSILGSMTDGLWVYGAAGDVVDVNQAALAMFGLGSRTEAIENASFAAFNIRYPDGKPVPPDDLPYARALRGMTVPDYLAIGRHLLTGRDLDLSIAAAPIESNGIVGVVLVIRDITALQELDRKKDEFLSVASHELRTPLTTIKGYTQLLAQTINDLSVQERSTYLTAVLGETERMMGLISELLDVSRIETNRLQIQPQPIPWLEFVRRRVVAFRIQNPNRIIRFEPSIEESLAVTADPDRMRQVIDNLLSNAIKYSPEGTDIEVFTKVASGSMLTTVADRGIGIPRDEIPHLFERFHRARNVSSRYYGGLGLGLYIARAIIESHDGSIDVESEEGSGSRFTIALPVA